ncbi:hypothetical protein OG21DRAFT_1182188 [Imleria badia]|nr:hypothetical protein OG21DRAFT_1182188 [Imleria badia]
MRSLVAFTTTAVPVLRITWLAMKRVGILLGEVPHGSEELVVPPSQELRVARYSELSIQDRLIFHGDPAHATSFRFSPGLNLFLDLCVVLLSLNLTSIMLYSSFVLPYLCALQSHCTVCTYEQSSELYVPGHTTLS